MSFSPFPVFTDGMVVFNGLSGSGTGPIVGATNVTLNLNNKEVSATAAGQKTRSFVAIIESRPTLELTIHDIGTFVSNLGGANELPFGSAQTCTSIDVYAVQTLEDGEIVLSGSNQVGTHYAISKGIVTLDSINAKQGSPATAKVTIHAESTDGVTNPITTTNSANLPSVAVLSQLYTLGQVELNGTTLSSINGMDYAGKHKVEKPGSNGAVYNFVTYVSEYNPEITVSSYDSTLAGTYGIVGLTSSSFVCYLEAMAQAGTLQANNAGTHIKIAGSASQGMIHAENITLSPTQSETRLKICPVIGTNPVLAISVASIT